MFLREQTVFLFGQAGFGKEQRGMRLRDLMQPADIPSVPDHLFKELV